MSKHFGLTIVAVPKQPSNDTLMESLDLTNHGISLPQIVYGYTGTKGACGQNIGLREGMAPGEIRYLMLMYV